MPDVLRYGAQIAGALEAAHRHGIVHRDLKPGNVMLTQDRGEAARLRLGARRRPRARRADLGPEHSADGEPPAHRHRARSSARSSTWPRSSSRGCEADARTDIFALGALLYEMATGQRAFRGESKTSLIAAIVSSQPTPVSQVVPMTPPAFDHVVRTCLAKDPEDRWQSARDVKAQLEWIVEGGSQAGAPAVVVSRRRQREQVAWALVAALTVATGALLWVLRGRTPVPQNVVRFEVYPPPGTSFPDTWWGSPIVSPDGRQLAFAVREGSAKARLWVRSLDSLETKPIPDSDEGITPFWSPDSRSIAFVSNGALKAVEVLGGAARVIAKPAAFGGAWSRDGVILFNTESVLGPLHRVSASGGPSQPVTTVDARGEIGHCCARFLPDGRFIFYALGKASADGRQYVGSLGSSSRTPLSAAGIYAPRLPPRRAAAEEDAAGTALRRTRLEPTGDVSFVTTETLARFGSADGGSFSVSESGVLAYRSVGAASSTRLVWFDRTGVPLGQVPTNAGAQSLELSPDGRRLLFERRDAETGQRDVWVLELDRGVESRLSFEAGLDESDALWSPDGRRIVWSKRGDTQSFQEVAAAGGAAGVCTNLAASPPGHRAGRRMAGTSCSAPGPGRARATSWSYHSRRAVSRSRSWPRRLSR